MANEETILAKIEAYIDENIQSVSLASLSGELGYSSVYTGHIVKKATGKSFSDYLKEKRCSMAAKLLRETEMPVGQVIHSVGYSNESFFRDKFKEFYGVSPLTYRKTLKNQGGTKH